ncbi:hypothetical protein Tco_0860629 [Tanacetum coccineum]|uniref:Uncharacterized protein n=1 Tax=Tanacetum coccineum TaxID=301880 RepID=A0ABQ5BIK7_9ASTR
MIILFNSLGNGLKLLHDISNDKFGESRILDNILLLLDTICLRCNTSVKGFNHRLPWLCKILCVKCTHFVNKSLIADNLEKWLNVFKSNRWNGWLFRSFHW